MPTPTARKRKQKKAQVFSSDLEKMWPWGRKEVKFHDTRRWAFDWADERAAIAVELDGYAYHTVRSQWIKDLEKSAEALIYGWAVLHITPDQFRNGDADLLLRRLYASRGYKYPRDEVKDESQSD